MKGRGRFLGTRYYLALACMAILMAVAASAAAPLPDPATGGKGGGPLSLLMLKGHVQVGFGEQPPLDVEYLKRLRGQGYVVAEALDFQPLTIDYLKQFNAVIYIYPSPYAGGSYFEPAGWVGGVHMLTVRKNADLLQEYARSGGGVLFNPALEEGGMRTTDSLASLLAPYGLDPQCAVVRDTNHAFVAHMVINVIPLHYAWTEAIGKHPATEGVKRIYFPTHVMRWDDNYTTIPLWPKDKAWTVLARGMPSSFAGWSTTSLYSPTIQYFAAEGGKEPPIALAREYEKGRVAAIGISHFHLFYYPYDRKATGFWEDYFGPTDGIVMEKGDGKVPSDLAKLLDNLYRWLAGSSVAAGFGGYAPAKAITIPGIPEPVPENVSAVWADKDPMVTGPIRPIKILVGARTTLSDGQGTPADYAQAAKKTGYDVVCFTETFEKIDPKAWGRYVAGCDRNSDENVVLLPGVNVSDALDNRFLLVGMRHWPRYPLLDETRKKLVKTGHMILGMGDVLPVAARPGYLATVREKGGLPADLYSHTIGFAVATYQGEKQVDDGMDVYRWQVFNASHPVPVAVHEIAAPAELAMAAQFGLQNYVNSDTPAHAALYYAQSTATFGGNPTRHYVSSGPLIDNCVMDDWQAPHWKVALRAHATAPITEALIRDQRRLYRRLLPNTNVVDLAWQGDLGAQHWFLTELRDGAGGRAILGGIRTLPERNFIRCGDRQNWFGCLRLELLSYTGRMRCLPGFTAPRVTVDLPGVALPNALAPRLQCSYAGPGWTVTDYAISHTYVPGVPEPATDSYPLFNVMPLKPFEANIRYWMLPFIPGQGRVTPAAMAVEIAIRLKESLKTQGTVWPVILRGAAFTNCLYTDAAGKRVEHALKTNTVVDLPPGGVVGNLLALTPLRVAGDGRIGFAAPGDGQTLPAGTSYRGALAPINLKDLDAVRASMGFNGPTPYAITFSQGKLLKTAMDIYLSAADFGVAGGIKGAPMPNWNVGANAVPVRMTGANPAWPVGLWRSDTNAIQPFGVFEGQALGRLDTTRDARFYFGNLLLAGNTNLNLSFASEWTKGGVRVEVNNPTDAPIATTITTPKAISDRIALRKDVSVPPGCTVYVDAE